MAWPEYGSFLMTELLEVSGEDGDDRDDDKTGQDLYVRFSLNGELLRSMWDVGQPSDMVLLERLTEKLRNEGKATEGMTS